MLVGETWKSVARFDNYEASSLGRIRRAVRDSRNHACRVLKPWLNNHGYEVVTLCQDGGKQKHLVHRIVCETFHGPSPSPGLDAAHNDGDPLNNRSANLRWATRTENMADCVEHGTRRSGARHWMRTKPESIARGEIHGMAKLCEDDIKAIRAAPVYNGSGRALAKHYDISVAAVSLIRNKKIWKHVT